MNRAWELAAGISRRNFLALSAAAGAAGVVGCKTTDAAKLQTRSQIGEDPADPESVISETTASEVEAALPAMSGGMRPKLQACVDAIHGGVHSAHIIDGRLPHSLLLELFTDAGIGTKVRPAR